MKAPTPDTIGLARHQINGQTKAVLNRGGWGNADVLLVELSFGKRSTRNAPRTLDLDILIYGDQICTTERLTLPHPRMSERAFVLVPLVEIAADIPVGVLGTAEQLLADISATGVKRIGPA